MSGKKLMTFKNYNLQVGWPVNWAHLKNFNQSNLDNLYIAFTLGDMIAFYELFITSWAYAFRTALHVCHDYELAEEGAQEAFFDIYRKKPNFQLLGFKSFKTMLGKVVRRRVIDEKRKWEGRKGQKKFSSSGEYGTAINLDSMIFNNKELTFLDVLASNEDIAQELIAKELLYGVLGLIKEIPGKKCRRALKYRIFGRKTQQEIGDIIGVSESRVCQLLQDGFARLHKKLIQRGFI